MINQEKNVIVVWYVNLAQASNNIAKHFFTMTFAVVNFLPFLMKTFGMRSPEPCTRSDCICFPWSALEWIACHFRLLSVVIYISLIWNNTLLDVWQLSMLEDLYIKSTTFKRYRDLLNREKGPVVICKQCKHLYCLGSEGVIHHILLWL